VKKLFYIVLFSALSLCSFAQGGKKEKIEALRVAFITEQLDLTTDESQKFWPLYNEYQDKLKAARREFKALPTSFANDKEAQEYLDAELLFKQRELSLYKEYFDKFKKILPVKKVAQLRKAEEDFKKELVRQLQGKASE
jgi:hypothetical protein